MIKNFFNTIATRITLVMMAIMFIPILLISYNIHYQQKEEAIKDRSADLKVILKQTISEIDTHIAYQKQLLKSIASTPSLHNLLVSHNPNQLLNLDPLMQTYVDNIVHNYNYYDFFIISSTGKVVYTFKKEEDYGKYINGSLLRETGLASVFNQATALLDTSISSLKYYHASKQRASFIATPIIINQKIVAVIALQLHEDYLSKKIKQNFSLGKTGEVLAGTLMEDGRVLAATSLKYDPDAFKNERVLNDKEGHAAPIFQAVTGRTGSGESIDYRGIDVVTAWGYEPNLRWGIVVKTDKAEVLESIYSQERKFFYIILFALMSMGLMISLGVRLITKPIQTLISAVQKFRQEGVYDPTPIECHGEICYLSEEFTGMATELESYHQDLEAKIEERTAELEEANKKLEKMSTTDQLTGLHNRRHLDTMCKENIQLSDRYATPFSIVIIDLDNFKWVNDTYGHQVGDYVLQCIADILRTESRVTDIVGRWGGEEFLILLPNLEEGEAIQVAEKLRVSIETYPFDTVGIRTASFGVSGYFGSMEETLKRADDALYIAKEQGRNCVVCKQMD